MKEFYIKMNEIAHEKSMTRKQIAKKGQIPESALGNLLSGKFTKNTSLRVALGLATAFDMSIKELIEGTEYDANL